MASHESFTQQSPGQESSLSYSVLENDADADLSFDVRRAGPIRREGSVSAGLVVGFLRACCPHFILVTVYLAFLLVGGGLYLLFESRIFTAEHAYQQIVGLDFDTLKDRVDTELLQDLVDSSTSGFKNLTEVWNAFVSLVEKPYLYNSLEPVSFTRSVMFCATTITTIGYGDSVPSTTGGKVTIVVVTLIGIPLTLILLADMGRLLARGVVFLLATCRGRGGKRAAETDQAMAAADDLQAPVVVVLLLLTLYFLASSCMIALVEGWSYGDALYFTFVTLTTIGFGDIVPVNHHDHVPSFIVLLIYVYLGLSMIAMSFILVRATVFGLISKVAGKIGF